MPSRPAHYCNGCGQPVSGSCTKCRQARDKSRGSSHARGYGDKWRKLRRYILSMEPMCRHCRRMVATELDHIIRKADGGTDNTSNLQPLCRECHERKTKLENSRSRTGGGV